MQREDDEELASRLYELETQDLADRRAELTGDRWLSLIHDQVSSRAYVFRHGVEDTESGGVPADAEVWEYPTFEQAEQAYAALLGEAAAEGELVDPDAEDEEPVDYDAEGAELQDVYSDEDTDDLVVGQEQPEDVDALVEEEDLGGPDAEGPGPPR
ncbi:MAG: hypothetical protein J2P40_13215 [Candidatus Dormibacteraeota bacterium]|nr:hypothetical protein [Candidatus Dormibacteraeota bacterium]MBO0762228.1 hypothetical protein [Candidatus Dormibacteraeota bacterium]